jgi:cytochrome c553
MRHSRAIALAPYLFGALLVCVSGALANDADIEAGRAKSAACIQCHGVNGNSTNGRFPVLAGQTATYIYFQLHDFKEGRRTNPTMSAIAAGLSDEEIINLAVFFSSQTPVPINDALDPQRVARGAQLGRESSCAGCHAAGLKGHNEIPKLAGQHPDYVARQLMNFKEKLRIYDGGTMQNITRTLSGEDMLDLAHFIGSLPPVVESPAPLPSGPEKFSGP